MSGKSTQGINPGECDWRVLEKLRRERSIAIDNLSSSSSRSISSAGKRLPPLESPVPKLLINSLELDDGDENPQEPATGYDSDIAASDVKTGKARHSNVVRRPRSPSPISKDAVASGLAIPAFVGLPVMGESINGSPQRRRSSLDELERFQKDKDLLGSSLGCVNLRHSFNRSRSPSPANRKADVGSANFSTQRRPSLSKLSPGSSPDASPSLCRRGIPHSVNNSSTGNIRGPPLNTEGRLKTRSAQYKLQKFLEETKSQFTTAQTLEVNAQAAANASEQK